MNQTTPAAKGRGLLRDTAWWGGEYPAEPFAKQTDPRVIFAGGGAVRYLLWPPTTGGVAVDKATIDLHATILHALGLDHEN